MSAETELGTELSVLAEEAAPPSRVDVQEALRSGRGRVRRRRAVLVSAAAVVVSSVALAAVLPGSGKAVGPAVQPAVTGSPSPSPSGVNTWNPVPPPSGPAATPSETRSPAPLTVVGSDPMVTDGRFGWLPDSVTTIGYTIQADGGYANATGVPAATMTPTFHLRVYPEGVTPELPNLPDGKPNLPGYRPGNHAIRVDAPPVNGREAYWITASDPNMAETMNHLRWKTAEGRWAELESGYLTGEDAKQVPLKVAAGVTTGHWQVPLPLRISDLPKDYTVYSVSLEQARDGKDFSLSLGLWTSPDQFVGLSVGRDVPDPVTGGPTGGPVTLPLAGCKTEHGAKVCVRTGRSHEHALDAIGGPDGLLNRITLFGTDPAKWSTGVLD